MQVSRVLPFLLATALAATSVLAACGSSKNNGFNNNIDLDGGLGGEAGQIGDLDAGTGDAAPPPPLGYVTGSVYAPEGTIPLSQALVYLTDVPPPAIPDGTYCDKCVQLTDFAYAYSKADGTFKLPVYKTGPQFVVTQKGQFRRVRNYDVQVGAAWPKGLTQLPGSNNPSLGDHIPKMLVMPYAFDKIDTSLRKLGITEFENLNVGPLDFAGIATAAQKADKIFKSLALMSEYKYVFLPCGGGVRSEPGSGPSCEVQSNADKARGRVLVDYVRGGGRLYSTDWSYEYVRQNWPGAITWVGQKTINDIGYACGLGKFSSPATFNDVPLRDWMNKTGSQNAQLEGMYATIERVNTFTAENENGVPTPQTPKVWVSQTAGGGAPRPATVSFQDRCGRVLYSTYHAEGESGGALIPQEKALLHVLLEVGVCLGVRPPPITN